MNHSEWYRLYTAALLETNPANLSARIHEAETAIFLRVRNLGEDSDSPAEREAIANALSSLRSLQRNTLRDSAPGQADSSSSDRT